MSLLFVAVSVVEKPNAVGCERLTTKLLMAVTGEG
jgi:hypothetical protein